MKVLIVVSLCLSLTTISAAPVSADNRATNNVQSHFKAMDANSDGKITESEHTVGARKMFTAMDTNKDDKVTVPEMTAAQPKHDAQHSDTADESTHRAADEHDHANRSSGDRKGHWVAAGKIEVIDTNKDGVLTAKEHADGSLRMFREQDTNKDGSLSQAEMIAGHQKHRLSDAN